MVPPAIFVAVASVSGITSETASSPSTGSVFSTPETVNSEPPRKSMPMLKPPRRAVIPPAMASKISATVNQVLHFCTNGYDFLPAYSSLPQVAKRLMSPPVQTYCPMIWSFVMLPLSRQLAVQRLFVVSGLPCWTSCSSSRVVAPRPHLDEIHEHVRHPDREVSGQAGKDPSPTWGGRSRRIWWWPTTS